MRLKSLRSRKAGILNGRSINDPTSSHGFVKFDLVSLENMERIEICRGKGAMKYGDGASGGFIFLITREKVLTSQDLLGKSLLYIICSFGFWRYEGASAITRGNTFFRIGHEGQGI